MKPTPRKATVTKVVGSKTQRDSFTGKLFELGNYVEVMDETGELHIFHNGALDQVKMEDRVEGKQGTVSYETCASFGLWFFKGQQ